MTSKLLNDLYSLTGIPRLTLENIVDKIIQCIGHTVWESLSVSEALTEIDIGFGLLYIKLEDNNVKYKFLPSSKLQESINDTITSKESPLITAAESSIKKKIENTYKELL